MTKNKRRLIELADDERAAYLAQATTITLCTHGSHGYPHAVAMWFVVDEDGTIWMTTYRKSQKALNVRRNPKVALLVESGTTYETLKGILVRGDAEIIEDTDLVIRILKRVHEKMSGSLPEGVDDAMRIQAGKRVAIHVIPRRYASWDHSRLGGGY